MSFPHDDTAKYDSRHQADYFFENLRGSYSYETVSTRIVLLTRGYMDVGPSALFRFATGKTGTPRWISHADAAVIFALCMLSIGLEQDMGLERALDNFKGLLHKLLGPRTARLMSESILENAPEAYQPKVLPSLVRINIHNMVADYYEDGAMKIPPRY